MKLLMSTKEQFKMYLPQDVIDDLDRVALSHGKRSSQEVVMELITFYLPVWKAVHKHTNQAVQSHTQHVVKAAPNDGQQGARLYTAKTEAKKEEKKRTG